MNLPVFKCRASKSGVLNTGYKAIDENGLLKIKELENERDTLVNANGNKVKWTDNKKQELEKLLFLKDNPQLGATCTTYLKEWLISQVSGKEKVVRAKSIAHGITTEHLVLQRASKFFGFDFVKNEINYQNDFFTGTPDTFAEDFVLDAKSCVSPFTMPYFGVSVDYDYDCQLQVYMELLNLNKAILFYGLENGTEDEINALAWQIAKEEASKLGLESYDMDIDHYKKAQEQLNYDHMPDWQRMVYREILRDSGLIESMKDRVIECRKYIDETLLPDFMHLKLQNTRP
jgi:hypothetical protein